MFSHFFLIFYAVIVLPEIKGIVQCGCGKLHPHLVRQAVEGDQVLTVHILDRHPKSHIRMPHSNQGGQGPVTTVESVRDPTDPVIGLLKALDADTYPHLWKFPAQVNDTVREITVGGDHDTVRLFIKLPYDIRYIPAYEGFPSGDVGKCHLRQLPDHVQGDLLLRLCGVFKAITHIAVCIAAVCYDHGSIQIPCHFLSLLS